ncbi:MAG: tRNA (adenosine(37)-N6)-dimethylallyltransferase MiaA [Tissierellia bacterium]|nr:tRNA (adenosine(37)-N6)-dimethylallyltransferase MiaA [Tissierellia bacterium]
MSDIIIIGGPTGTGKTSIGIELSKRLDGEIISADSVQIYRGLDIGSAKATTEEMKGIPHHLIDISNPDYNYSVAEFQKEALKIIDEIIARGKVPIIVGGTGLYINSLIYDWKFNDTPPDLKCRKIVSRIYETKGIEGLVEELNSLSDHIDSLDYNNPRRVMRALEIALLGGNLGRDDNRKPRKEYSFHCFALIRDREKLYDAINIRVDNMMENGLLNEAYRLYSKQLNRDLSSQRAIGYKELYDYFDGNCSKDDAVSKIKQHSRQYAKRQLTWFKNQGNFIWIDRDIWNDDDKLIEHIIETVYG